MTRDFEGVTVWRQIIGGAWTGILYGLAIAGLVLIAEKLL